MDVDNKRHRRRCQEDSIEQFRYARNAGSTVLDVKVDFGFWLSLRWVPSAANHEANAIVRPGLREIIRLRPAVF